MANLTSRLKKSVLTAGLVLATSSMYSCGITSARDPLFIYPKSLYGIYEMHWNELEDTYERNPEPEGTYDMELLTLGSDERVQFRFLSRHTFDRDSKYGSVCDSWVETTWPPFEQYLHTVCGSIVEDQFDEGGNVTELAKIDLIASVDIFNAFDENIGHLTFGLKGNRKQGGEQ